MAVYISGRWRHRYRGGVRGDTEVIMIEFTGRRPPLVSDELDTAKQKVLGTTLTLIVSPGNGEWNET